MDTIDVAHRYQALSTSLAKNQHNFAVNWTITDAGGDILEELQVVFPAGHAGLTGVRVNYGGVTILPWNMPTTFLYGDNERQTYQMGIYVSGPLQVVFTNNDNVLHTFQLVAKTANVTPPPTVPTPIALLSLP